MKNLILILLLLFNLNVYCQQEISAKEINIVDSKFDSLSKIYSDTLLLEKLITTAKAEGKNNPNVTLVWMEKVDSLYNGLKLKSNKYQTKILLTQARALINSEKIDSAYNLTSKALGTCINSPDSLLIANCYGELGIIFWKKNRATESIHFSALAIKIYEKYNNKTEISRLNNLIGIVHQSIADYDKSLEYFLKALKYAEEIHDTIALSRCYNNLGAIYRIQGQFAEALKYSELSLAIKEKQNDKYGIASNLSNIGGVYFDKGDYINAIHYSSKALQIDKEINNNTGIISNLFNLARVYYEQKNFTTSKKHLIECMALCEQNPSSAAIQLKANFLLAKIYEKRKSFKLANDYLNKAYTLKDSLMGIEKRKAVAEVETRLKSVEFDKKIELLEKDKIFKENEIKKSRLLIITFALITILLLLLLYIQLKSKKHLKQKNQIINEQHNELEKYKNQLEILVDEKSRDLKVALLKAEQSNALKSSFLNNLSHEIRTPMNAVMGILNVINAERDGEMVDELKIVNTSFNQLLYLIEEILLLSKLHTEQVDIKYREVSLKLLFQDIVSVIKNKISESNKNIEIEFEFNGDIIVKQDSSLIFKMLEHIIDNAVKYTDSGKISLGYGIENSKCYGYVKDTGIGIDEIKMDLIFQEFQKAEVEDRFYQGVGIGLAIVKKISDLIEAPVTVESEKNKGTTFRVEFKHYNVS